MVDVKNLASHTILKHTEYLASSSGRKIVAVNRPVKAAHESVQGAWDTSTSFQDFELRV